MAADIVPELNIAIKSSFQANMAIDGKVRQIEKKIESGKATLKDAHDYSVRAGENLSGALKQNLTADTLPDGKMYWNIADRTVKPAMKDNYDLVNQTATRIQKDIDEEDGIGLNAVEAEFPEDRIKGIMEKLCSDDEDALDALGEPVVNATESFFDDYVRANAEFRSGAGLTARIIREAHGHKPCEWCQNLAGSYVYGVEVTSGSEVFKRHDRCRCTVTYESGKVRIDVHRNHNKMLNTYSGSTKHGIDDIMQVKGLKGYVEQPITKTDNQSIREWYVANVSNIPSQIDRSRPTEEQARQAFTLRNKYKHDARIAMADRKTVEFLEKEKPAPTFEELIEKKMRDKGLSHHEAILDILRSAATTNTNVNKEFGL